MSENINRRSFFKMICGAAAGVYAVFVPSKAKAQNRTLHYKSLVTPVIFKGRRIIFTDSSLNRIRWSELHDYNTFGVYSWIDLLGVGVINRFEKKDGRLFIHYSHGEKWELQYLGDRELVFAVQLLRLNDNANKTPFGFKEYSRRRKRN